MEKYLGIIRHILTFGAGVAVGKGWLEQDTADTIIAGAVALIGFIWSVLAKKAPAPEPEA